MDKLQVDFSAELSDEEPELDSYSPTDKEIKEYQKARKLYETIQKESLAEYKERVLQCIDCAILNLTTMTRLSDPRADSSFNINCCGERLKQKFIDDTKEMDDKYDVYYAYEMLVFKLESMSQTIYNYYQLFNKDIYEF